MARVGQGKDAYRVLVGKPDGRDNLGNPRYRWDYNIKMKLQVLGYK